MLAELRESAFDDNDWIFETKYDGYRAIALCNGHGGVELYSRNMLSFNSDFKPIVESLKEVKHPCLLDGEIVVENEHGRSAFQLIQNYQKTHQGKLKYYVFDLLNLDGNDITGLPLLQRKELLKLLFDQNKLPGVFYSKHVKTKGIAYFKQAVKNGLEGIIAKKADSFYESGKRTGSWLKIKITKEQEAIIVGITAPKGNRNYFGSLLLAVQHKNQLQYIGHCGTGFDENTLKELYAKFKPLFTNKSPFEVKINANGKVQWLKPKLVCQVKFTEWTVEGNMRHPVYLGLRQDKEAKEVVREIADSTKSRASNMKTKTENKAPGKVVASCKPTMDNTEIKIGRINLKLTNQQKIYWPGENITKGDLVSYYTEISPVILPYLKNRPQSLNRFPNGINGESFYQKDINTDTSPSWLKTEKIYSESNKTDIDYLVCNDKATLIYMANLGCIEINPWNSRITNISHPDWLVIDLDPEAISFKEVVKAALQTKKFCDQLEIDCYCKTSGATGLHIFVPLGAKYDYDVAKNFANLLAKEVNEALPGTTSILRMPQKRQKKVYLDFLQNRKGQTLASPYSVRPRPGATVSTPLHWEEVNEKLDPTQFTIKTIFRRLDKKGDLWQPVLAKGANLKKALTQIEQGG